MPMDDGTGVVENLAAVTAPILAIGGGDDDAGPADRIETARAAAPRSSWALYRGAGAGFFDETAEGYRHDAAEDAWDRIVGFLDSRLGTATAAA